MTAETKKFAAIAAELVVFREPFADQRSAQRRADRHRNGVEPGAVHRALGQLAQVRLVRLADLAPGHRHRAEKRANKATEEDRGRDRDRHPRDDERHQGREEGLEVDDRGDDDRMRVAERELEQQQADDPDRKQGSKLAIVGGVPEQQNEVAAALPPRHQERNRDQQGDLGQEHKLRDGESLGRQKRKRLLHRQEERGDDSVNAAELIIYSGFARPRLLHLGEPASRAPPTSTFGSKRAPWLAGADASGPCRSA